MKKHLFLKSLLIAIGLLVTNLTSQMWADDNRATWIGKSFIVVGEYYYRGSGEGSNTLFNGHDFGAITSLSLGGQVRDYGQSNAASHLAKMGYKFDGDDNTISYIELAYLKFDSNDNWYQTTGQTVDISGLTAGDHTIAVWFEQPYGWQDNTAKTIYDSNSGNNYVASFSINPLITFHANGGAQSDYTQRVSYGTETALTANSFSRTGYTFAGWATSSDGSKVYNDGASVTLTEHLDLYAKWTPKTTTVSFNVNGGTAMSNVTATYDAAMPSISKSRKLNYAFNGIYDASSAGVEYYDYTGAGVKNWDYEDATKTLYVYWTPAYEITINAKCNGTVIGAGEYTPVKDSINGTYYVSITAPVIPGYTFSSWTLGDNISKHTSDELTSNTIRVIADNSSVSTLTANYTLTSYVVTYPDGNWSFSDKSTSVEYTHTGSFTVHPAAGYRITSVTASAGGDNVPLSDQGGNSYSFTQGTAAVTISVTVAENNYTVTIENGTTSQAENVQVATNTGTATVATAAAGKKFDGWVLGSGITLVGCEATDRTITFHASQNSKVRAAYTDRSKVTVHFARPKNWSTVTAVFSNDGASASTKQLAIDSTTYEGAIYYTFLYYTDNNGEPGGDQSGQASWNRAVFSDNGNDSKKSNNCTITDGNYYAKGAEDAGRGTPYAEWYLRGYLNNVENRDGSGFYNFPFSVSGTSAEFAFGVTSGDNQYFRIYRVTTGEWFRMSANSANVDITLNATTTLHINSSNGDVISTNTADKKGVYLFRLTNINNATPSLTVTHPNDTKYGVTIRAAEHGSTASSSITQLGRYLPTEIVATADAGYRFKEWVTTGGAVVANPTSATTTATATAEGGTITATFTNKGIVYLDKTRLTDWTSTPYVYFYSGPYWDNDKGSGAKDILWGGAAMTRIGDTDIWYYDYSQTKVMDYSTQYIAFTNDNRSGHDNFYKSAVIYRADFFPEMNMLVPENFVTKRIDARETSYYGNGYWMKYNEKLSGYNLRVYDGQGRGVIATIELNTSTPGSRNTYKAIFHVEGEGGGELELQGHDIGTYHGNTYSGTYYGCDASISASTGDYTYYHGIGKPYITFTSAGDYEFTLNCDPDGHLKLSVTYPLEVNDFRIKYNGLLTTEDGVKGDAYSNAIPQLKADGTRKDTVSFFVTNKTGLTATLSLDTCSKINPISWGHTAAVSFEGDAISGLETGVYNFEIVQTRTSGTISFSYRNIGKYNGNYYIRTDCAAGGWAVYKQDDHIMHTSNYDDAGFDMYFVRHVDAGKNVKFCIANKYSPAITKEISSDSWNATGAGSLTQTSNVRFEFDTLTNVISRAYLGSSSNCEYLYIRDANPDMIFKNQDKSIGLTNDTISLKDQQNWIYMIEVYARPKSKYKVEAVINSKTQYFVGSSSESVELLGGTGTDAYKMRLIYDFKNNHLIKAWLPASVVSTDLAINADVMLIRKGQGDLNQLNFSGGAKLSDVKNVYAVMEFIKDTITNHDPVGGVDKSSTYRSLYWISYPFDVKLKDIFGFGTFGEDYIIRRYNGAKRAEIGWFLDTDSFWETMDPDSEEEEENTMKAFEGYMLAIDKGLQSEGDSRWKVDGKDISSVYLYFPSVSDEVGTLMNTEKVVEVDSLPCRINRAFANNPSKNHMNTDANWRVVGVGSLHNTTVRTAKLKGEGSPAFNFYTWNSEDNSLISTACTPGTTVFKAGHAYMTQFAGKLKWQTAAVPVPASVAARERKAEKKNYSIEVDMIYNESMEDRTYVILEEQAASEFVLGEDLYKAMNSTKSNIYAFAGGYDCGISRVPVEDAIVPVGVKIKKAGEYTFSIPNTFSGEVVLVDKFAQTRTNLNISDYEVYLNKGTIDDRFELEINLNNMPTAIDGVEGGSLKDGKAHKFIQNGVMYILKDGELFDARGNRVK